MLMLCFLSKKITVNSKISWKCEFCFEQPETPFCSGLLVAGITILGVIDMNQKSSSRARTVKRGQRIKPGRT